MRNASPTILFFALLVLLSAPPALAVEESPGACAESVAALPVACAGGNITNDADMGSCREVTCADGLGSLRVLACDKPDAMTPEFFEVYKQADSSGMLSLCIGDACIGDNGYARGDFTCTPGNNTGNATNQTNGTYSFCGDLLVTGEEECDTYAPAGYVCTEECTLEALTPEVPACVASVKDMAATCQGGGIVDDTFRGCRSISCVNGESALRIFACDKPDTGAKTYFEMYKHFQIGQQPIKICLGDTCMSNQESAGFARSDLPACHEVPEPKDTSAEMHIAPWYPQGNNYIFVCSANNFVPESFNYYFGDGSKLEHVPNTNVYHTYAPGEYDVKCVAKNGMVTEEATLHISVPGPKLYLNDWQKWETFVPGWSADGGMFKATNTAPDIRTEAVYKEGYGWTDYSVTGSMVFWSAYAPADSRLVFRYQDPTHYGACRIMQDYGQTRLELIDGNGVLNATAYPFNVGQWYTLKASIDGDHATCEVVGQPQTRLTAKYNETASGTVGLRNAHFETWYKDVAVELH